MPPLDWMPSDVVKQASDWDFSSTVSSAMSGLHGMGSRLMQPIGQQMASLMPAPPPPQPPPQPPVPEVKPFALPSLESWGMSAPKQPQAPPEPIDLRPQPPAPAQGLSGPAQGAVGAGLGAALGAGSFQGFTLPSLESWGMGQKTTPAAPPTPAAPTARPDGGPAPSGPIVEGDPQRFFATARPYADAAERATGVPASLSLAIAANETGYGQKRYMAGANNYHGIQAQPGEPGAAPYKDWRPGPGGQQQFYDAAQRAFADPAAGFMGFAQFLTQNPRYAPALARYKQSGDVNQLAADVHQAGYAEDPAYTQKITSIMRGIPVSTGVGSVTDTSGTPLVGGGSGQPAQPQRAAAPSGQPAQPAGAPRFGTYTPETLTPNQVAEGASQGLSAEEALAICGPAAAVAFARSQGRNPTLREAKELASRLGLWDVGAGMHGPAAQVQLLDKMGVPARLQEGTDWTKVAAEVQQGRPVIVDTPMHYFTVTNFDPQTGEFEFGQSAGVLRASKGRTRFRPQELPSLGMGSPRATIFLGGGGP